MNDSSGLGIKHLQVRLTGAEHAALQDRAGGPGQLQRYLRQIIQSVIEETGAQPKPTPHQPWIDKLLNILNHGTPGQIHGIQSNLEAFCAQIELDSLRQGQPRRRAAGGD